MPRFILHASQTLNSKSMYLTIARDQLEIKDKFDNRVGCKSYFPKTVVEVKTNVSIYIEQLPFFKVIGLQNNILPSQ